MSVILVKTGTHMLQLLLMILSLLHAGVIKVEQLE